MLHQKLWYSFYGPSPFSCYVKMISACPSLRRLFGPHPSSMRVSIAPILTSRRGQQPMHTHSKGTQNVQCNVAATPASLHFVRQSGVLNKTGPTFLSSDVIWLTPPREEGCTNTSVARTWRIPRAAYSTSVAMQKPFTTETSSDRQQQGQSANAVQTPTSEEHDAASRQPYSMKRAGRPVEGGSSFSPPPTQRQNIDRGYAGENSAVHSEWNSGSQDFHVHPPLQEAQYHGQLHHGHGYPPQVPQCDVRTTSQYSPPPYTAYGSPAVPGPSGSVYHQYSAVPPGYGSQWDGISNSEYMSHGAVQQSPPHYMGPEGTDEMQMATHSVSSMEVPHPYNNMPLSHQESYPHMYPMSPSQPGIAVTSPHPSSNLSAPQLFPSSSPGVPFRNALSPRVVTTSGGDEREYPGDALDTGGATASAPESFLVTRSRGHLSAGGSGEERLEQLLAEIRQRLGNRANMYDSALEQDPRALLELACRPESLRRMQYSSLDWWYVLFRWQDRYHAMQLSGEIRRRNAAAAAAAVSPSDAATTVTNSSPGGPGSEGTMGGRGQERSGLFSFFSPEDEEAFFTFLQKLQQAFAARPLSEEAQTHGRLHDRMRCIRQLARAVSDDHRALGMGAASRKEADSLLWSLAVQEARCAANTIDVLRTKGGMPMLLSILRLAETADRRRRRSATRVLVPVSDGSQDANRAGSSETDIKARQHDVIIQNFPGGRALKWEWVSAEETQNIFDKLADAFLSCAQEANIEPCVHAVVGMGTLTEKSFLNEGKWQKVCQAMTDRLKLSEMVSAGSEAGLLLDSLTWMFVRNANASRRCRHVIFQVNFLLGQILRDTRSDVVARCVLGLALCRVFREENLLFYTSVLLKRQLRSDEPRKTLTPRAFCNLLVANAIAGVSAKQHLGVVTKYLLNTTATHDRAKNLSLDESARLAWAICALRLYDPAIAGTQWPAKEAAELLSRLLSRIGKLVDGPQAAYILEALRDSHDSVAPLYPNMGFSEKYADLEIRRKACFAYDQSHLGLGGTIITVVRGALRSFGGTVKPGPERRSLLTKLRNATSVSEQSDTPQPEASTLEGTEKSGEGGRPSVEMSLQSSTGGNHALSSAIPAEDKEGAHSTAGVTEVHSGDLGRQPETDAPDNVQSDSAADRQAETLPPTVANASNSEHATGTHQGLVFAEGLRQAEWIEGAILDGYPVAFYSPNLKVALDVDVCSKLPSKYMKRRHMDNYLRENGIRHVVFCADLKRPQEPLYSFLERMLKDETGTLGDVGLHPTKVRAFLRTDRGSSPNRTEEE